MYILPVRAGGICGACIIVFVLADDHRGWGDVCAMIAAAQAAGRPARTLLQLRELM